MAVQRYRKKPVVIEAVQYSGENWREISEFADAEVQQSPRTSILRLGSEQAIEIATLEGLMVAEPGDWIIRGIKGEFYPCRSDIFEATYERVADDDGPLPVPEVRGDEAP